MSSGNGALRPRRIVMPWRRGSGLLLIWAVVSMLAGCAITGISDKDKDADKIHTLWPEPPEQPRYEFLTMLRSLADIHPETEDERLKHLITGTGVREDVVYDNPAAIAAGGGRIYVADPRQSAVVVFDVPRRAVFRFGTREPHALVRPHAVALDAQGRVYVLDSKLKRVLVFDGLGLFDFQVGEPTDFTRPVGVAVSADGNRIYVVDRGGLNEDDHKVVVYSPSGEKVQVLGPRGKGDGQFDIPLEAAVGPDGILAVLDSGNFRVQLFDAEGRFLRAFGSIGNRQGQFSRPRGLAIDPDGNIYVTDADFNNVQVFDSTGRLLMAVGGANLRGGPGEFALIGAVAADQKGFVYVADSYFKKIEVYRRLSPASQGGGSPGS